MKNTKVIVLSLIALGFIVLSLIVNWLFILGAIVITIINQRELVKKK